MVSELIPFCGDRVERSSATFWNLLFFFSLNDYRPKHWNECNSLLHVEVQLIRFQKWGGLQCKGAIWLWLQTPLGQRQNLGTPCRERVTGLSMPHGSEMPYSEHFSSSVALSSRSLPHLKTPDTSHPPRFPLPSQFLPWLPPATFWLQEHLNSNPAPVRLVMRNQDGALMGTLHACGKIQEATRKIQVSCLSVMHF